MVGKPIFVMPFAEDLTIREGECFRRAIEVVNGLQAEFRVQEPVRQIHLPGKRNLLKEDVSFDALYKRAKDRHAFCITPRGFQGNEFQTADERCSLLSLADWEQEYAPPSLQTYIVYQFAFAFLTWAADHVSDQALTHKKTIGCRMDYCRDKHDLKLGMLADTSVPVAADICPSLGRDVC
jgi:hypothetical protein